MSWRSRLLRWPVVAFGVIVSPARAEVDSRWVEPFSGVTEPIRLLLELRPEGVSRGRQFELWWSERECWFLRFLQADESGKFLGQSPGGLWLATPMAARPVSVGTQVGLGGGAGLADLFGPGLLSFYRVVREHSLGELTEWELIAENPQAPYPKLLWVANTRGGLPVRVELRSSSGRALRSLEFRSWLDRQRRIPAEIAVADISRGTKLGVRFLSWEMRPFDRKACQPEGSSERAALPAPLAAPR